MRIWLLTAFLAASFAVSTGVAAEKAPREANGIRTLFVEKGNASAVLKAINALHARMEAEGWSYRDMSVYTEDGDLEGVFVTYVRATPGDALAAPAAAPKSEELQQGIPAPSADSAR
jgi:hypothetical protein